MTTEYSGRGDPARSMALLWRRGERPSRKGKAELSVDRIVRAAIEIADTEGLAALSMRRVAERLGVGTMSLYTHVPGKAELLDVMLDTVLGEVLRPEEELAGGWRARLERIARDQLEILRRHPWVLQVSTTTRPPPGPNIIARYDYELRAVDGIGLTDLEMDSVITLVSDYVHSAARGIVDAANNERHGGITDEQWWSAVAPLLEKVYDYERHPVASRVGAAAGAEYQAAYDPERAFEFGLARVLDGIEVLVRERAGKETEAGA